MSIDPGTSEWQSSSGEVTLHKVKPGECLSMIAQQYGLHWIDVAKKNSFKSGSPSIIYPGETILIEKCKY